jgi:hypothetical protein
VAVAVLRHAVAAVERRAEEAEAEAAAGTRRRRMAGGGDRTEKGNSGTTDFHGKQRPDFHG